MRHVSMLVLEVQLPSAHFMLLLGLPRVLLTCERMFVNITSKQGSL